MKLVSFFSVLVLSFCSTVTQAKSIAEREPNGSQPVAHCTTGDAIAGLEIVYGASKTLYALIYSQKGDNDPATYYIAGDDDLVKNIRAGQKVTLTLRSDESFDFGGETSHASLLELQVRQKPASARDSRLAEGGGVIALSCSLPKLTP